MNKYIFKALITVITLLVVALAGKANGDSNNPILSVKVEVTNYK